MFTAPAVQAEPPKSLALELWPTLAEWVAAEQARVGRPLVVGLCGPQGSGKSTGAEAMRAEFEQRGLRCAVLGLDDLYLGKVERQRLARTVHPLFATRGPPGTHDVALGIAVIERLRSGETVRLPSFDKGADDRAGEQAWPGFEGPADVVIFEGWCVGARPQDETDLAAPVNGLEAVEDTDGVWRMAVNAALAAAYQQLFEHLDRLILLRAPDFAVVEGWRIEQEHGLRRKTGRGMSDDDIGRFVQHYERLTRYIHGEMPSRADIVVDLATDRRVQAIAYRHDA